MKYFLSRQSYRTEKVSALLKKSISEILQNYLHIPVYVVGVNVDKDLRRAHVRVVFQRKISNDDLQKVVNIVKGYAGVRAVQSIAEENIGDSNLIMLRAVQMLSGFITSKLSKEVELRKMPKLEFFVDKDFLYNNF